MSNRPPMTSTGAEKLRAELKELIEKGLSEEALKKIHPLFDIAGDTRSRLDQMKAYLETSEIGLEGISEMEYVLNQVEELGVKRAKIEFDVTLARGLNYYTGAIFEVKANGVKMGSICLVSESLSVQIESMIF